MVFVGVILILIGISALTGIPFFNFIFAVVLIVIGVRLIMGRPFGGPAAKWEGKAREWGDQTAREWKNRKQSVYGADTIDEVAVFSPLNKGFTGAHFTGGKIVAVFSSAEIDLSGATAEGSTVEIEVSSVFSSVEITIPKDWNVRPSPSVFLGNVDTHQAPDGEGSITFVIRGEAVFGEIEIRK